MENSACREHNDCIFVSEQVYANCELVAPLISLSTRCSRPDGVKRPKLATIFSAILWLGRVWVGVITSSFATALATARLLFPEVLNLSKAFTSVYFAMATPLGQTQDFLLETERKLSAE